MLLKGASIMKGYFLFAILISFSMVSCGLFFKDSLLKEYKAILSDAADQYNGLSDRLSKTTNVAEIVFIIRETAVFIEQLGKDMSDLKERFRFQMIGVSEDEILKSIRDDTERLNRAAERYGKELNKVYIRFGNKEDIVQAITRLQARSLEIQKKLEDNK